MPSLRKKLYDTKMQERQGQPKREEVGGAKVIFKLLLRKIAHCKHDQKEFFLSNAPTYQVCFHRSNFDLLEQS